MPRARTWQFWLSVHRYCGLATFVFLSIAALTGCFLCFDKTIDAALNADLFYAPAGGTTGSPPSIVARFAAARPDVVVRQFPINPPPGRTIEVTVGSARPLSANGDDQIFLDSHDGHVVGTRRSTPGWDRRHIVAGVFQFHSTLLAGRWGRWLMGVAAIGWLIGNVVGGYLTLPVTGPFWRKWKKSWKISRGARLRRLMLELHRSSGLWLLIGATVLAFTSAAMNFYDEAFNPAVMALSPPRPSPFDGPAVSPRSTMRAIGLERAIAIARTRAGQEQAGWHAAAAGYDADRNLFGISFTDDGRENYRLLGPVTYYVEAASGRVAYVDDPYRDSAGRKLSRALYPLHSGEVVGPVGIAIIFLLGLATAEMCFTGVYTWLKKRQSRVAGAVASKALAAKRGAGGIAATSGASLP